MKFVLSRRVSYISIFIISIFAALYWWQIQVSRVKELENMTKVRVDIEKEFEQIHEVTMKLHDSIFVQDIVTIETIDTKAKNYLI